MLGEYGFPTPAALGIVEITPEREYLIAMDFFDDAAEIGEAEIDARVIDEGLAMIRLMWDVGLAHRDIKPANRSEERRVGKECRCQWSPERKTHKLLETRIDREAQEGS